LTKTVKFVIVVLEIGKIKMVLFKTGRVDLNGGRKL